jgi:uncharacterized protein (TIGR02145 family)
MLKNNIMIRYSFFSIVMLFLLPLLSFGQSDTIQSVKIGKHVCMTRNLNVSSFRNGDPIPHAKTNEEWKRADKNKQPAWCYYDNDSAYGVKYGKLYNWYAVTDPRGLAPKGWHIPSREEWIVLTDYLGGEDEAGTKMRSKQGWSALTIGMHEYKQEYDRNGTNSSGFSGLPGGYRSCYRYDKSQFKYIGACGFWWCSSEWGGLGP